VARRGRGPFPGHHSHVSRKKQNGYSILNFYINRAGKQLSASQKRVLERAKGKLREAFGREPQPDGGRPKRP